MRLFGLIGFVFFLTSDSGYATDASCGDALLSIRSFKRTSPKELETLVRALRWNEIQWKDLFSYVDPGQVSKERPAFPGADELLRFFSVSRDDPAAVRNLKKIFVGLSYAFKDPRNFEEINSGSFPELFQNVEGAELKSGAALTRLKILELFIEGKIRGLSSDRERAVDLAFMDLEKHFGVEVAPGVLRLFRSTARLGRQMWFNRSFILDPARSAAILWNQLLYRFTRHMVNSNFHHPALAHESFTRLAFLMENARLRRADSILMEQLPPNFQAETLASFADWAVSGQLARGDGALTVTRNTITTPILERVAARLGDSDGEGGAVGEAQALKAKAITKFKDAFDQYQKFLRQLLFEDLEQAYQAWKTAELGLSEVSFLAKEKLSSEDRSPWRWVTDQYLIEKSFRSEADSKAQAAARKFAEVYLNAETISDTLHFRLPSEYRIAYEGSARVKLEGVRLLRFAEKNSRKGNKAERLKLQENALRNFVSSPLAWGSLYNPTAFTAQFMQQFLTAGLFQNPAVSRTTAFLGSLMVFGLMLSWPYLMSPAEDSQLEKVFANRVALTDDAEFKNAKWTYLQKVRLHGIPSADKPVFDSFFTEDLDHIPPALRARFEELQGQRRYLSFSSFLESRFPATFQALRGTRLQDHWESVGPELDEILDFMRLIRRAELQRLLRLEKLRPKALRAELSPVPKK
jgi:hypothetical protein